MSDESKHTHKQDQNSCTVLQIVVQFPGHPAQTQQADHLEGAEQAADALRGDERRDTRRLLQDGETLLGKWTQDVRKECKTFQNEARRKQMLAVGRHREEVVGSTPGLRPFYVEAACSSCFCSVPFMYSMCL